MFVCECEPPCPRVTSGSDKDVEEVECGAGGQFAVGVHIPCGPAPAASPAHDPMFDLWPMIQCHGPLIDMYLVLEAPQSRVAL
eukprot:842784-Prymnesium_polylepis.1